MPGGVRLARSNMDRMSKTEFLTQVRAQMHAWQARFDEFRAKGKTSRELGAWEYHGLISSLQQKVIDYEAELVRIERVPGDTWHKLAMVVGRWHEEMDRRLCRAMERLE